MRWTLLLFLLSGCVTRSVTPPMPCDLIDDRPGLREEIRKLKLLSGDPTKRLRWYALDADISCAGNRVLGAKMVSVPKKEPSFWARIWTRLGL